MADSNITKRALAAALKDLMDEKPFAKISVGDICDRCDMNRKSFYYHFKDKFELLNWIFDTECIVISNQDSYERRVDEMLDFCRYLYEHRKFYQNALQVRGQNSFLEHFHELIQAIVTDRLEMHFKREMVSQRYVVFTTDAIICALVRWITQKDPISPEQFAHEILTYVVITAEKVCEEVKTKQGWENRIC